MSSIQTSLLATATSFIQMTHEKQFQMQCNSSNQKVRPNYLWWIADFAAWLCALIYLRPCMQGCWPGRWEGARTAHWSQVERWWKGRKAQSRRRSHSRGVTGRIMSFPSTPPTSTTQGPKQQLQNCIMLRYYKSLWQFIASIRVFYRSSKCAFKPQLVGVCMHLKVPLQQHILQGPFFEYP
jgi:hypothetical protein